MPNRRISPSLADLDQDIAGILPVDVILRWSVGKKDQKAHAALLQPFMVKGTVVSSDSSGLSKLTQSKTLLEVMKLVSEPKEIIFDYGKAVGGTEVGLWAADNTQMFYDERVSPDAVLQHMIAAQQEINKLSVRIGLSMHFGEFIQIGGGLFGEEAEMVEGLAENYTQGGEIAVTEAFLKTLSSSLKEATKKKDAADLDGEFYSVVYDGLRSNAVKSGQVHYPYPFTKDFFELIREGNGQLSDHPVFQKYAKDKIVVLVKVAHQPKPFLLDQLSEWMKANIILKKITRLSEVKEVKSNGSLGIFVADSVSQAIAFATDVRDTLSANAYTANIGLAKGEVLLFPLEHGGTEIAGGPVNIASKLAEDCDAKGKILIESSVDLNGQQLPNAKPFRLKLSAVELTGVEF